MIKELTIEQALEYEIHSRWWIGLISWEWAQKLVASYITWKTKRKYAAYVNSRRSIMELAARYAEKGNA